MIEPAIRARGFGLNIATVVPIPGAMPSGSTGPPDVEIGYGTVPEWEARVAAGPYRAASRDLFDFTMPELVRFTCIERRRILIDVIAGADPDHVAAMLIATALPALLWARGDIVLHAAAAILPAATTAVAVAGDSGAGKSRWLARAIAAGATVVADDSLRLRIMDGRVMASGLAGGYFQRYGPHPDERDFVSVPAGRQGDEQVLGAIHILDPATSGALRGPAAVIALLRHRHRPRVPRLLGLEPTMLAGIAAVATTVPICAGLPDPPV